MLDHDALGFPGRARSIDHVGQLIGAYAGPVIKCRTVRLRGEDFRSLVLGQHQLCPGIRKHVAHSLLRIIQVDGQISRPRLMDADDRRDECLYATHPDSHKAVVRHAVGAQEGGDCIRSLVQFAVGITAFAVHDRRLLRNAIDVFPKEIQPCLPVVADERLSP